MSQDRRVDRGGLSPDQIDPLAGAHQLHGQYAQRILDDQASLAGCRRSHADMIFLIGR